jgi:hypothetical protein
MIRHSQKKAAKHMTPTAHNTASINLLMAHSSLNNRLGQTL